MKRKAPRDSDRPDPPSREQRTTRCAPGRHHRRGPDRALRRRQPGGARHRLRRVRGGRQRRRQRAPVGSYAAVLAVAAARRPGLASAARGDRLDASGRKVAADRHRARRAVPHAPRGPARDRRPGAHRRRGGRRHARGNGSHPHRAARVHPVPGAGARWRRVDRRAGARRDRRLRHLSLAQQPRLERSRAARPAGGRRPRQPCASRRARPGARALRRSSHHCRGRRAFGRQHAARPRPAGAGGAGNPGHLADPQRLRGARHHLAR